MKELIKRIEKDKLYFYCDIFKEIDLFMKNHPDYLNKIKDGNNGYIYSNNPTWGKNNFCFYLLNDNNEKIPISYTFSLVKDLKKQETLKAFRTSIDSEIIKFKKDFIPNLTKCAISGDVIRSFDNLHVDHHNHDFLIVVEMFLKKYNKTYSDLYKYVIIVNTKRFFNNKDLINYFIEFHNKNTTLRYTTQFANLSKKKQK